MNYYFQPLEHVERAFADHTFNFVFNLCGETRFGLGEEEYKQKTLEPAKACADKAATTGTKWIEMSSGQVYKADKSAATEESKISPWTVQAKYRFEAENAVRAVDGLESVILRPAIIYGPGDLTGLMPRMACAVVYKELGQKMQFLWTGDLRINTVHIRDVVRAMWAAREFENGSVWNLADSNDTTQGKINELLGKVFGIETGFQGTLQSKAATKIALSSVAEMVNNKHVPTFQKVAEKHQIANSPISPFLDKELLKDNHLSLDGSKITKDKGFAYEFPDVTEELFVEEIRKAIDNKHFPPVL
jgi:nucleoside-diphosphate-sugar epimerase